MLQYLGALGIGTVQGKADVCHTDHHYGPQCLSDPSSCWHETPLEFFWGAYGSSQQKSVNTDVWNMVDRFGIFQGKSKYKFISSKYMVCFYLKEEFTDESTLNADRSHPLRGGCKCFQVPKISYAIKLLILIAGEVAD